MKYTAIVFAFLFAASVSFAGEGQTAAPAPKEFEQLKVMVGKWEAKTKDSKTGKEDKGLVTYELTSGGTAIVEKLFAGTPHEMVSIYHTNNGKVAMTHYCMAGNQPELALKKATEKTTTFELDGTKGITNKNENHMHGLVLTMVDKDHMKQEWSSFEKNKQVGTTVIELTRKTN